MAPQHALSALLLSHALSSPAGCIWYEETPAEQADVAPSRAKTKTKTKTKAKTKALESLGYVDGTVDASPRSGVTVYEPDAVHAGYSFYTSRKQYRAQLIDMQGNVVHVWEAGGTGTWQHATLLPDGDIIVLVKDKQLLRLDADSNVKWTLLERVHHDLWVHSDSDIYALARRRIDARYHPSLKTVEDYVVVLSATGERKREISILRAIEASPHAYLLGRAEALPAAKLTRPNPRPDEEFDILHTNHVEVMDGSLADRSPIFAEGNLLVSPRNLNAAVILDAITSEVLWIWGPNNLLYPHDATVTPQGTILIFNNGSERTRSQVIEVDPLTGDVVWTYGPTKGFFSVQRGSNQRLPNGNTLITESDTGYVFEVTAAGEVVWRFANPHLQDRTRVRMAIWRMTRHAADSLTFPFNR